MAGPSTGPTTPEAPPPAPSPESEMVIAKTQEPQMEWFVKGNSFGVRSLEDANRKVPKNLLVTTFASGQFVQAPLDKKPANSLEYKLSPATLVWNMDAKEAIALGKWFKSGSWEEVHGYAKIPAGGSCNLALSGCGSFCFLKVMCKLLQDPERFHCFQSHVEFDSGPLLWRGNPLFLTEYPTALGRLIDAVSSCPSIKLLWSMSTVGKKLVPRGMVLWSEKQLLVNAKEEKFLP